jgi:hypothetical protein
LFDDGWCRHRRAPASRGAAYRSLRNVEPAPPTQKVVARLWRVTTSRSRIPPMIVTQHVTVPPVGTQRG